MSTRAETDRRLSIASDEFIWDSAEHTEAHRFLAAPVMRTLAQHGVRSVLDLGCGNGSLTAHIAAAGFEATGLDHSESGIRIAAQHHPGVTYAQHDITQPLPSNYGGRYDAVVSVEVMEHLLLPRMLLLNANYALRPNGLLIVSTPYHGYWKNMALALTNGFDRHWHPLRDYGHVKFFSRATLLQLLAEQGFSQLQFSTVGRIPALARSMIASGIKAA